MGRTARANGLVAVALLGLTAAGAWAGPIVSSGPYNVTLPGGGHYIISGTAQKSTGGYLYTYSVTSLNDTTRTFELGLASHPHQYGNYTETNVQLNPGPGILLHDQVPHTTLQPWLGRHNYVFTGGLLNKTRFGIPIGPQETQIFSFEDPHNPFQSRWSLREVTPSLVTRNNDILHVGRLPVPGAPEPSTLVLAACGLGGLGLGAFRRWRRKRSGTEAGPETGIVESKQ